MLNPNFQLEERQKIDFEPLPPDVYQFELIKVDLKTRKKYQTEELESVLSFEFACIEDGQFYGRRMWKDARPFMSGGEKPSNLYTILSGITGRTFTPEDMDKTHGIVTADYINNLVGCQVRLTVSRNNSENGKIVNKIVAFLPVKEPLAAFDKERSKALGEAIRAEKNLSADRQDKTGLDILAEGKKRLAEQMEADKDQILNGMPPF